jgi:NAD(P)-dependent dehydrogenase (short-subunit alcohol dehydrogenase family)
MTTNSIRTYQNAVAIVTGAASGIGRALACELAARGANVVLADLQMDEAQKVAETIRSAGGCAKAAPLDVTDFSAVDRLVRGVAQSQGRLDYLFNNAGIAIGGTMNDLKMEDWNRLLNVNLHGVIHGAVAAYPVMRAQRFGHIVNTASMAGLMANPLNLPYATAKHAVVGLSLSMRAETAHLGLRASVICPGVIRTPILDGGRYGAMKMNLPPEKGREMLERLKPMPPDLLARKVLNAVAKNRAIMIFPWPWKMLWWLNRLSPTLGVAFARNRFAGLRREFGL